MNTGWICPRCGKVNAPDVKSCDCKKDWDDTDWRKYVNPIPYSPPPTYPQPIWIGYPLEYTITYTSDNASEYIKGNNNNG